MYSHRIVHLRSSSEAILKKLLLKDQETDKALSSLVKDQIGNTDINTADMYINRL